jgi:hypothetical protein
MTLLADITHGHVDGADAFFLIATILAVFGGLAYASRRPDAQPWAPVLVAFAIASIAFAWLLL